MIREGAGNTENQDLKLREIQFIGTSGQVPTGKASIFSRTRVIFYVRRIGLYLYKYRIYGTISIYILKGLAFVYQLI